MPWEEGDDIREYKVMHEENFLSSWLREDGEDKGIRRRDGKKRIREEEKKRTRR